MCLPHDLSLYTYLYIDVLWSHQVKKRQQRALFILDSLKIEYEAIDITEPGNQEHNDRFREVCKKSADGENKLPLPPQFFNQDTYCGVSPE